MRSGTEVSEGGMRPAESEDETDRHRLSDRRRRNAPGEKLMNGDQLKKNTGNLWGAVTDPPGADDPAPEIFRSPGNKKYFAMPDRGPEIEATSFLSIKIRTRMIRGLTGRSLPCDAIRYWTDICDGAPLIGSP